jgi:hypothetical protein
MNCSGGLAHQIESNTSYSAGSEDAAAARSKAISADTARSIRRLRAELDLDLPAGQVGLVLTSWDMKSGAFFVALMLCLVGCATTQQTSTSMASSEPPTSSSPHSVSPGPWNSSVPSAAPSTDGSTPWGPSSQPSTGAADDSSVAAAAEKYVLQNLMADSFQSATCGSADQGTPHCWQPWVTGFTFSAGVLRVMVQAPEPDNQQVGENAAHAVANFIKLGSPPTALSGVQWVESTDGVGTHIAQYPVR